MALDKRAAANKDMCMARFSQRLFQSACIADATFRRHAVRLAHGIDSED